MKSGWVYILTNSTNKVFYVGVTSDLKSRIHQHKSKFYPNSFTARYAVNKLVYYAEFPNMIQAIAEEKRIKGGNRAQKIELIISKNRDFEDLSVFI